MKAKKFYLLSLYSLMLCHLIAFGCSTAPTVKMPKTLPSIVREYKHVTIPSWKTDLVNTGIYLNKGDFFSVLVDAFYKRWNLTIKVEKEYIFTDYYSTAPISGHLYIGSYTQRSRQESIGIDIIVWEKEDWIKITKFFQKMKENDPGNTEISNALSHANNLKEIYMAEVKTSQEIKDIKVEIQRLKEEPKMEKEETAKIPKDEKIELQEKASIVESETQEKIAHLEVKLGKLIEALAQLEEMKKELKQERMKTNLLTKQLQEKDKKEKELLTRLEDTTKTPPLIVIGSPKDRSRVKASAILLSGVAEDDQGVKNLEIFINNESLEKKIGRGIKWPEKRYPKRIDFVERIPLQKGANEIRIRAIDVDGLSSEKLVTVQYIEKRRNVWAAVIGINNYPNIRQLKYAVNDARMFYDYLVSYNRIPAENVTLLLDKEATLTRLRSVLGTHLKKMAGKEDMVLIFFAGHGATEKDVMSPDGDGLEKYLLPYNADPNDLYATALPVGEISRIFERIQSERLVFIADSCYSGASGGRTIGMTGIRSNLSEIFFDRLATGKGRVIITASGANEVSTEKDELQHGVFTYYLIEGLRGHADADKDGLVTVDEVYRYVSDEVPRATGQEQHPVKKGTVEGRLILSVVQ